MRSCPLITKADGTLENPKAEIFVGCSVELHRNFTNIG
jgi:hypothetical protein